MVRLKLGLFATKKFFRSRNFALCILFSTFAVVIFMLTTKSNTLCIVDSGDITYVYTTEGDENVILNKKGVEIGAHDKVSYNGTLSEGNYAEVRIERAFPVTVSADGKTQELYFINGTVGDALKKADKNLGSRDMINYGLDKPLEANDHIVVNRVNVKNDVISEPIPFQTEIRNDSRVLANQVTLLTKGIEGTLEKTIFGRYVDGKLDEYTLIKEEVVSEPVTEIHLKGSFPTASPFLPFDGVEIDETGRPTNYVNVLSNQVATAYSARVGAKTASGRYAIVGHVAVNPAVIPYGTKLYIETSSGNYAYGYAIAADTGIALLDGRVDVDLFYGSYAESVWWGKRSVDIYILP
ncbi:MAG: G5 domain-containing protein [Oscillospiraceae bacterium]|jgi:3D (Asp-Asp-Asp) domain-containing protein|nr:G5 domain-containing protein [Oscillospiraceae bacterium]